MAMDMRGLPPGTIVHNRYRVDKVLGAGGFGVTYRVTDLKANTIAAMKEYMPLDIAYRPMGTQEVRALSESTRSQYEKFRESFLKEAQTIYNFRGHPNIVEVNHLFYENNTVYYVMEYVEGLDLRQFLRQQGGKISWEMLSPIIAQVVAGLKTVHGGGMIHCDISPDNIFLMKSGAVKILDFGAARNTLRGTVDTSVIVAKPGYSPYEQMRGKNMGAWTDIYALAVTIYHSLTGRQVQDSNERIIQDNTIWPSQMGIVIPSASWERALQKGMALRTEDRYQSVTDFWQALSGGDAGRNAPSAAACAILMCVQGVFNGSRLDVTQELVLGVDPGRCHVTFPLGTPGISRVHIKICPVQSGISVMDMGSTYGSWLDGVKLSPGVPARMKPGSILYLGGGQVFRAV